MLSSLLCHCRDCQRTSGKGHVVVVQKQHFQVTGESRSYAVAAESGKNGIRNFCPNCGSLLFGTPAPASDKVTLYVGTLDDSSAIRPCYAQFTRSRAAWDGTAGPLPEFETVPPRK